MTIDVTRLIGAVIREISSREVNGAPARVLMATRRYDTTIDDLWDALTNPERIPRWFLPISGDLKLGGRYQLEGNANGEIVECAPPRRLGLTWGMHGQISWVNIELSEESKESTLLRLEHIAHVPDELWKQFGPGGVGIGWDEGLLGLDRHLTPGATLGPETATAWLATEEGKSFIRKSSAAWCSASIAAGDDAATARAAADRVAAMYTGEG
jgi:uncharacterized protein YndB with AHSA1/START domain